MSEKFLFWQWKNQQSYNFSFICGSFSVRIISYYHRLENFMEFFNEILREKNGIGWEISFTPTSNPQSTCMPGRIRNMKGKICILVGILYRTVEENLNLTTCFDMLYTYISIVLMYSTFALYVVWAKIRRKKKWNLEIYTSYDLLNYFPHFLNSQNSKMICCIFFYTLYFSAYLSVVYGLKYFM